MRVVISGDYKRRRDLTCDGFEPVLCDLFVTEATFALPVFRHPPDGDEIQKLLQSLARNPDRVHLVGVYALGKAQRVIALLREAGYDRPIHLHGALTELCDLYAAQGVPLGSLQPVGRESKKGFAGEIVLCPPSSLRDRWSRGFPNPVTAMASGWMRVRQRARQRSVELPLILSDHADWDELTATLHDAEDGQDDIEDNLQAIVIPKFYLDDRSPGPGQRDIPYALTQIAGVWLPKSTMPIDRIMGHPVSCRCCMTGWRIRNTGPARCW